MRYAVYLTPPMGSALADAAAAWLGRSPFAAAAASASGAVPQAAAPREAKAHVPARYGFHATLRAPFRLAEGIDEGALLEAFARYAPPATLCPQLSVARLSRFLAFRSDDAALGDAAKAAVEAFEPFRAPLTAEDRARRNPDRLDARGLHLLERWGYPHVMERFVFHMTLSGPLGEEIDAVETAAKAHFGALDGAAHPLVHAIYREREAGGPFEIIAAHDAPELSD